MPLWYLMACVAGNGGCVTIPMQTADACVRAAVILYEGSRKTDRVRCINAQNGDVLFREDMMPKEGEQ